MMVWWFIPPPFFFRAMGLDPSKIRRRRRIEKLTRDLEFRTVELRASFNVITQSRWKSAYLAWVSSLDVSHLFPELVTKISKELGGKIVLQASLDENQAVAQNKALVNKALDDISTELHRALTKMRVWDEEIGL